MTQEAVQGLDNRQLGKDADLYKNTQFFVQQQDKCETQPQAYAPHCKVTKSLQDCAKFNAAWTSLKENNYAIT